MMQKIQKKFNCSTGVTKGTIRRPLVSHYDLMVSVIVAHIPSKLSRSMLILRTPTVRKEITKN